MVNGETNGFDVDIEESKRNGDLDDEKKACSDVPVEPQPEAEKIIKWREEKKIFLENKDAEEEEKKEALKVQAKREMDEWYNRYYEQLEKSKLNNR